MFLAAIFPSIQPGDSQDHISLITNSFVTTFHPFLHVCILQENLLPST